MEDFLVRQAAVNTVQRVSGEVAFLVEVIAADLAAVEAFVDGLYRDFAVGAIRVLHVVRDVAREAYLTDPLRYPHLTGVPPLEPVAAEAAT